jgi:hypothetical protein
VKCERIFDNCCVEKGTKQRHFKYCDFLVFGVESDFKEHTNEASKIPEETAMYFQRKYLIFKLLFYS